jgi:hypothetical protein
MLDLTLIELGDVRRDARTPLLRKFAQYARVPERGMLAILPERFADPTPAYQMRTRQVGKDWIVLGQADRQLPQSFELQVAKIGRVECIDRKRLPGSPVGGERFVERPARQGRVANRQHVRPAAGPDTPDRFVDLRSDPGELHL